MSDERSERIKQLFLQALDLPVGGRAAFVEAACAGDDALRREVLELLLYLGADSRLEPLLRPEALLASEGLHSGSIGRFRILGLLGRGGMGVVYTAEQDEPPRRVALKVLSAEMRTPGALARFHREARVLRQLDHPGIARFHDAGVFDSSAGPVPYLAMEVVEGLPLEAAVEKAGLDTRGKLGLLAEVCDAVAYAHRLGIVHRDLKPDNILVRADGQPMILDFGVSRIAGSEGELGSLATRTGMLLGTPQYMSPEQAQGLPDAVGPAADVYALGVIAFELLAGRPPYDAQNVSLHRAMVLILTAEAPRLGTLDPTLRGDVESIVAQALEKRPEDRYPSAAELGADIRRHLSRGRVRARRVGRVRDGLRTLRRRPLRALLVVTLLTAVGTALASWRLISRPPSPEENRTRFEAVLASIEAGERLIQGPRGPRGREELLEALTMLERARRELSRIPPLPYMPDVKRYTLIRSGEAQYFLGLMDYDPEALSLASNYFDEAARTPQQAGALAKMDSTALRERIGREGAYRPLSLIGTVHQALTRYETPLEHLKSANGHRGSAMTELYRVGLADSLRREGAADSKVIFQMARNDLAETLFRRGATELDVQMVNEGIEMLVTILKDGGIPWVPPAHASVLANLGAAYMHRGELTNAAADLDSALHYLEAALTLRPPDRRLVHAETRRDLAEAVLRASRFQGEPKARLELVDESLRQLALGLYALAPADHPAAFQLLRNQMAEALTDRALLAGATHDLVTADSLLELAEPIFTRKRRPLQHAELQLLRATLLCARWELYRDEQAREEARRRLEIARDLTARDQYPSFHARLDQEFRRLGPDGR